MSNSIDFYKGIFLHVIPIAAVVPWSMLQFRRFLLKSPIKITYFFFGEKISKKGL